MKFSFKKIISHFLKVVAILFLATANLYSGDTALLVYDPQPLGASLGFGNSLLDSSAPIVRNYTGLFGNKEKGEATFNHVVLPNQVSLENAFFMLKQTSLRGVKVGGYLNFLNRGDFTHLDDKGRFIQSLQGSIFHIGVPIVVDYKAFAYSATEANTVQSAEDEKLAQIKAMVFDSLTTGVNINFFQSSFDENAIQTLFGDINVAGRFKIPYYGMAIALMTPEELSLKRDGVINGLKKELQQYEPNNSSNLTPADPSANQSLPASSAELNAISKKYQESYLALISEKTTLFDSRLIDIARVSEKKKEIGQVYRVDFELQAENISNFFSEALTEINDLILSAQNELRKKGVLNKNTLTRNIASTESTIKVYLEKIKNGQNKDFISKSTLYASLFREYIQKEHQILHVDLVSSGIQNNQYSIYSVKRRDSWEKIAENETGNISNAAIIQAFNNNYAAEPEFRSDLYIPDQNWINNYTLFNSRKEELTAAKRGYKEYTLQSFDTNWALVLSNSGSIKSTEKQVLKLNGFKNNDFPVSGQTIKVPVESYNATKAAAFQRFRTSLSVIESELGKLLLTAEEKAYFKTVKSGFQQTISLYNYLDKLEEEVDNRIRTLNNVREKQGSDFAKHRYAIIRELQKANLKKSLGNINAKTQAQRNETITEYKQAEKALFNNLLIKIYNAKAAVGKAFMNAEKKNYLDQLVIIQDLFDQKRSQLQNDLEVAKYLVTQESGITPDQIKIKQAEIQGEFQKQFTALDQENEFLKFNALSAYDSAIDVLKWDLYISQQIYKESGKDLYSLGTGVYVNNIGAPITTSSGVSESLPTRVGVDINYLVSDLENHSHTLVLHYGNSVYEGNSFGFGVKYRLFKLFEVRTGLSFQNGDLILGGGASTELNFGLMTYRIDGEARYTALFGPSYTVGINILF